MSTPYFTPRQAMLGTLLGGPFATVVFIGMNYASFQQPAISRLAYGFGSVMAAIYVVAVVFLPDRVALSFGVVNTIVAYRLVTAQVSAYTGKLETHVAHKHWRVAAAAVASAGLTFLMVWVIDTVVAALV